MNESLVGRWAGRLVVATASATPNTKAIPLPGRGLVSTGNYFRGKGSIWLGGLFSSHR